MIDDDPFGSPLVKAPVTLDMMSIEELEARIVSLKGEIEACAAVIESKRRQRSLADSVFNRQTE